MKERTRGKEFVAVVVVVSTVAVLLAPHIEREQAKQRAIEADWIREQIEAERAYEREAEAERRRWELNEVELAEIAYATEMEKLNYYNDPDIPDEVEEAARKYGEAYGLAPEFLEAVAYAESRYDPEAINGGCVGLMQVAPVWHWDRMERLGVDDDELMTVEGSMAVAAGYLRELFDTYDDPYWVLMTYNGDSNAEAFRNGTAAPSDYALRITEMAARLTKIHEEGGSGQ